MHDFAQNTEGQSNWLKTFFKNFIDIYLTYRKNYRAMSFFLEKLYSHKLEKFNFYIVNIFTMDLYVLRICIIHV